MATNKLKSLLAYNFKEPKFNYGFIQANSNFFNRAFDFVNDEENDIEQRSQVAHKCIKALEIPIPDGLFYDELINLFIESFEEKVEVFEEETVTD